MPTPIECERFQGLPDDYTRFDATGKEICKIYRLPLLGNAWTVPVIAHLFRFMFMEEEKSPVCTGTDPQRR